MSFESNPNETPQETPALAEGENLDPRTYQVSQENLSRKGLRNIQGFENPISSLTTPSDFPAESPASNQQETPEIAREKSFAPLSPETKMELNRIKNLPVEQRFEAMGTFFSDQKDKLGNVTNESKSLQLDSTILGGGKGVLIRDENGEEYLIEYE